MGTCPKCGAELEDPRASFCSECGEKIEPSGGAEHAEPPGTEAESREEYRDGVRRTLADGVLDEQDAAALEDTRVRLELTPEEAEQLRDQEITTVATEMGESRVDEAAEKTVLLESNPNQFYMVPYAGILDFRLTNLTDAPLRDVRLAARAKWLGEIEERRVDLPPGIPQRVRLQIGPEKAGVHTLDVSVTYRLGGRRRTATAQELLQVLEKPEVPSQVVFDQRVIGAEGSKIGFGFILRNEGALPPELKDRLVFSADELIQRELPPQWLPLALRSVGWDPARRVRVAAELDDRRARMSTAGLYRPDGETQRRVLLLGQPKVRFGRNRKCNVVLRLWPRTGASDSLSKQISAHRPHMVLSLKPGGLFLADQDTLNGTCVNGENIRGEVPLPLDRPSEVHVARALRLRLVPFLEDSDQPPRADRYQELARPDDLWKIAEALKLRSLRIERVENLARQELYVIVYRWANCGRRVDSEIPLPDSAMNARIVRLGGQFWLEGLEADPPVCVDGVSVGPGRAAPLAAGMRISCGTSELKFDEFRQIGL